MADTNNRPVASFGSTAKGAAVWKQTTKEGNSFYKVGFTSRYLDSNNDWKDSKSMSVEEAKLFSLAILEAAIYAGNMNREVTNGIVGSGN